MPDTSNSPIVPRHRQLVQVVDTMNCGLLASDLDGVVRYANPRLLGWLGYRWDEVIDNPAVQLGAPEHAELHEAEMRAIQGGDLRVRLVVLRRKDSTTFPALVIPQRFFDDDEVVLGTFSIIIDLGAVQTAKRIGLDDEPNVVTTAMMEIVKQLKAIQEHSGPQPHLFNPQHEALKDLSPREFEVLEHLMVGERVANIAENLFISNHTVRNHLKSIYRKTGTVSQADLIDWVRSLE